MRTPLSALLACTLIPGLASIGTATAASIAVNFNGNYVNETIDQAGGETTAALNALFGISQPVWTNLDKDQGGTSTTVTDGSAGFGLTYHAAGGWYAGSEGKLTSTSDASQQIFRGYLDDGDGGKSYFNGDGYGVTLQLSGLSSYLASVGATQYRLTVLLSSDSSGLAAAELRLGNLPAVGTATSVSELPLLANLTPTVIGNGTAPFSDPVPDGAQNVTGGVRGAIVIDNLSADAITLAFATSNGGIRGSVAGFVLTPIPELSTSLLSLAGAALLLRRRRH